MSNLSFFEMLENKNVVVDTSSLLLTGTDLLESLPDCNLIVPSVVVKEIEEKRNHGTIGFLARQWLRLFEEMRTVFGKQLSRGIKIPNYENITLRIEPNHSNQDVMPKHLRDGSNDSTILAVAVNLEKEKGDRIIILSNDIPMRLHATLDLSLESIEYVATDAFSVKPFDGKQTVEINNSDYVRSEFIPGNKNAVLKIKDFLDDKLAANIKNSVVDVKLENDIVGTIVKEDEDYVPLQRKQKFSDLVARNLEQDMATHFLKAPSSDIPIVSIGGRAGSGKTLLSIGCALDELKAENYQRIIVFRSLHEMGEGQELGFLPGDLEEKMEVWAGAVYDSIDVIAQRSCKNVKDKKEKIKEIRELIDVSPITYLRGRSLSNAFVILEEAQNFSRNEILNILSRCGENTKMVLTWDADQVDNKYLQSGAKSDVWSVVESLKNESIFAHVTLKNTERSVVADVASRLLENG